MATNYYLTKKAELEATEEQIKLFVSIRDSLPFERYPNGCSGWKDCQNDLFTNAGFILTHPLYGEAMSEASMGFSIPSNH